MWKRTSFIWQGGLRNLPVTANLSEPLDEPVLQINYLEAWVENGNLGHVEVEFGILDGSEVFGHTAKFINEVLRPFGGSASVGYKYNLTVQPVNGEAITKTVAVKIIELLRGCGIHTVTAPRIISESFEGAYWGNVHNPKSYGELLFQECLAVETLWDKAVALAKGMSDSQLLTTWSALEHYDPKETANGLPMDEWAEIVYSEKCNRGL